MMTYSIGELSRLTAVKVTTIRYYEQIGLMDEPHRSAGNQRRYLKTQLDRLTFIKHARDLGFSIRAISELIAMNNNPSMPCREAHKVAQSHLKEIEERLVLLNKLKHELERITKVGDVGQIGTCYVLQSLSQHSMCENDH